LGGIPKTAASPFSRRNYSNNKDLRINSEKNLKLAMPILRLWERRPFFLRRYVDAPSLIGYGGTLWGALMAKPKPYEPPVSQLLALGDPREGDEFGQPPDKWLDYRALGLREADADELVRLATDFRREPVQYAILIGTRR
jgi:hypothetical protein